MMELRPANKTDCEFIFKLRNSPENRLTSLKTEEITLQDHKRWFKKHYKEYSIIIYDFEKAGYLRISKDKWVSVAIDDKFKRMGLGSTALSMSRGNAIIKLENPIALHNSLKAGFKMVGFYLEKR